MTARPQIAGALHAAWGYARSSRAELNATQDAALRRLALHAYEQVRYFRRLFDRHRLLPRHLRGVIDLDLVPVTERDELVLQRESDLLARGVEVADLVTVPLGEEPGAPRLRRSRLEDLLHLIQRTRALSTLGLLGRDRIAVLSSPDGSERSGFALHLLGLHRRRQFDPAAEPRATAEAMADFRPDVIIGSSAALARVAEVAAALRPRLVVVEGRPPMPRLRTRLATAFQSTVRAAYGIGGGTVLATECPTTGAYHVAEGWALVEVLADGRSARPGERGEVAVTLLHSFAMPVLRLRLGHLATRGELCACGAPSGTILTPDV